MAKGMQTGLPDGRAGKETQAALLAGETIIGWAKGVGGYLVATDQRVLVVKIGALASGSAFGKFVSPVAYGQIQSVEFQHNVLSGFTELVMAGAQAHTLYTAGRTPYAVVFYWGSAEAFRDIVRIIRERVHAVHTTPVHIPAAVATAITPDIPGQIAALKQLLDTGALTQADYDTKKAELLTRM